MPGTRILVVDDDTWILKMVSSVLERRGTRLVHNRAGANMAGGVASALAAAARGGGRRVDGDLGLFEVDEFKGDNHGLIVAEVELPAVDAAFPRPSWLGREVSALTRYYNVNLIAHPYRQWSPAERAAEDAAC